MKKIFTRFNCLLCDLALSYVFLYLFLYIKPIRLPIMAAYFFIVTAYYLITYFIFKRSVFQLIFGLEIQTNRWAYILLKAALIGAIPFVLTYLHSILILTLLFLLLILISLIIGLWKKKSLWQLLAQATVVKSEQSPYRKRYLVGTLLCVLIPVFIQTIKEYNFFLNEGAWISNSRMSMPVSFPAKQKFIQAINRHKQDPVEYIFRLFEENDVVILCERLHPEQTQWHFFSQIILNDRFATKIGNVFTELGNAYYQKELEEYMNTKFCTMEDLKKATARIARESSGPWAFWTNTNWHDFLLNLHEYNLAKDSSHKINLFFSDSTMNWQNTHDKKQWDIARYSNRDSIMANTIIAKYNELLYSNVERKKMLVIMNTRHAFKGFIFPIQPNVSDYLSEHLPSKMANILINGTTQLLLPMKGGLWDEAALEIGDEWAVDYNECVLGNIFFDLFPIPLTKNLRYKDVFSGMIYYKHPKDWRESHGYEYILDSFKDTLLYRLAIMGYDDTRFVDLYEKNIREERPVILIKLFNFCFLVIHYIISIFLLINVVVLFILSFGNKAMNNES